MKNKSLFLLFAFTAILNTMMNSLVFSSEENTEQDPYNSISRLPPEIFPELFPYLSLKEICNVRETCREWNKIASDEKIWEKFNIMPAHGRKQLADMPSPVVRLDLSCQDLNSDDIIIISTKFTLVSLNLDCCNLFSIVENLTRLTHLTSLDIAGNFINPESAKYVAVLTKLMMLNISNNKLGSEGVLHLTSLTNLVELHIDDNNLLAEDALYLGKFSHLKKLSVAGNNLDSTGMQYLTKLSHLTWLNARGNDLKTEGAYYLTPLTNLMTLCAAHNNLDTTGVRFFTTLTNLTELDITGNDLGMVDVQPLIKLKNLKKIGLHFGNNISDEELISLRAEASNIEIREALF